MDEKASVIILHYDFHVSLLNTVRESRVLASSLAMRGGDFTKPLEDNFSLQSSVSV